MTMLITLVDVEKAIGISRGLVGAGSDAPVRLGELLKCD